MKDFRFSISFFVFWDKFEKSRFFLYRILDIEKMPDRDKINKELESANLFKSGIRFSPSGELVEGSVNLPNNLEDFWIQSVGNTLYEKFVKYYTKKMWLVDDNTKIDSFGWSPKGVTLKDSDRRGWGDAKAGLMACRQRDAEGI